MSDEYCPCGREATSPFYCEQHTAEYFLYNTFGEYEVVPHGST